MPVRVNNVSVAWQISFARSGGPSLLPRRFRGSILLPVRASPLFPGFPTVSRGTRKLPPISGGFDRSGSGLLRQPTATADAVSDTLRPLLPLPCWLSCNQPALLGPRPPSQVVRFSSGSRRTALGGMPFPPSTQKSPPRAACLRTLRAARESALIQLNLRRRVFACAGFVPLFERKRAGVLCASREPQRRPDHDFSSDSTFAAAEGAPDLALGWTSRLRVLIKDFAAFLSRFSVLQIYGRRPASLPQRWREGQRLKPLPLLALSGRR